MNDAKRAAGAATVTALALLALGACSSEAPASPSEPPIKDVRAACDARLTWKGARSSPCSDCLQISTLETCTCDSRPERGRCLTQSRAWAKEPECDATVDKCVQQCAADCACAEACFAGRDRCRAAAGAVDGCVLHVCGPHCEAAEGT